MTDENSPAIPSLADLRPKMPIRGRVTKIELFGAFIDVGAEVPGLVHISNLKRGHVNRVEDVLQEGQEVEAWVLAVNPEQKQLLLTLVRPVELPWRKIKQGMVVEGKVVRLESFGAFVDIGAERPGLVHVSELSSGYISHPSDAVAVGETVKVKILEVDRRKRQIRLSIKAVEAEEALEVEPEEEEPIPTAMEVALRKALHQEGTGAEKDQPKTESKQGVRKDLDDILSRTLQQRVKTSTGDAPSEAE